MTPYHALTFSITMPDPLAADAPPPPPPPLSDRRASGVEIAVVVLLTVVLWPVVDAIGRFRAGHAADAEPTFTNASLLGTVVIEAALAAVLLPWLARRGWTPSRAAGAAPGPADVVRGLWLWFFATACYAVVWGIFATLQPELARVLAAQHFAGSATAPVVVLTAVLNPLFEEFLWLGYLVPALLPRVGLRGACALSLALRVSVHLYQGVWAFIGILPVTLCMTWYYGRTRRIWPVVVAHVVLDVMGLAQFVAARP